MQMNIYEIIFSPTGGTKQVSGIVTGELGQPAEQIDLTDRTADFGSLHFGPEDLCVVSVPSYGGRVPEVAVKRLKEMSGGGARAVLIAVYGNRAYEESCGTSCVGPGSAAEPGSPPWQSIPSCISLPPAGRMRRTAVFLWGRSRRPWSCREEPPIGNMAEFLSSPRRESTAPSADCAPKPVRWAPSLWKTRQRPTKRPVFPACAAWPCAPRRTGMSAA